MFVFGPCTWLTEKVNYTYTVFEALSGSTYFFGLEASGTIASESSRQALSVVPPNCGVWIESPRRLKGKILSSE